MAAPILQYDHTLQPMASVDNALRLIRSGLQELERARAIMLNYCDGDTAVATNWDQLRLTGGFSQGDYSTADHAAQASFLQVDTLYQKLAVNTSVIGVRDAIFQTPEKHGI
jgi:hypothetical protein